MQLKGNEMKFLLSVLAVICLTACNLNGDARLSAEDAPAFNVTIEVVVPKGTEALAFVPNANRSNFADGRGAIGIALFEKGETFPLDSNFVIQTVTLSVPAGATEAVLCSGHVPGTGYHAYFAPDVVAGWRSGEALKGLAAVISAADRNRLGPKVGPVEKERGFPKKL